jgi:hypothetical protein
MKIISQYKDYYDYLAGIWGIDDKLVLDRRERWVHIYKPSNRSMETVIIGEWMYQGVWIDGKLYWGEDLEKWSINTNVWGIDRREQWIIPSDRSRQNITPLKEGKYLGDKSPTWKLDCPILILDIWGGYVKFPILRELGIQSLVPPEEVWKILSDFLSKRIDKREVSIETSDMTKILNSGFDPKISFRKRK